MIEVQKVVGSTIVVDEKVFNEILGLKSEGIIVTARMGLLSKHYLYQLHYNDFIFLLKSRGSIPIPDSFTVVVSKKIVNPALMVS